MSLYAEDLYELIARLEEGGDITIKEADDICDLFEYSRETMIINSTPFFYNADEHEVIHSWYCVCTALLENGRRGNFIHSLYLSDFILDGIGLEEDGFSDYISYLTEILPDLDKVTDFFVSDSFYNTVIPENKKKEFDEFNEYSDVKGFSGMQRAGILRRFGFYEKVYRYEASDVFTYPFCSALNLFMVNSLPDTDDSLLAEQIAKFFIDRAQIPYFVISTKDRKGKSKSRMMFPRSTTESIGCMMHAIKEEVVPALKCDKNLGSQESILQKAVKTLYNSFEKEYWLSINGCRPETFLFKDFIAEGYFPAKEKHEIS